MERGLNSDPIDKSVVHEVRPLRTLVPVFPNAPGMTSMATPNPSPFVCVSPSGPFPPGVQPFYPFLASNDSPHTTIDGGAHNRTGNSDFGSNIPAPAPLNTFRIPQADGETSRAKRASNTRGSTSAVSGDDGYSDSQNQNDHYVSGFSMHLSHADDASNSKKRRGRPRKRKVESGEDVDVESVVNDFLTLFELKEFDDFRRSTGDKDTTAVILLVFDLTRRKLTQLEEARAGTPGIARPDLKACSVLMNKGVRTNNSKRIGNVPGIDIGDIFFLRMELCLVGLHAPSMAGIDYMSVKITMDEEPVAVSIVSSGGYDDDDGDDSNVLIYCGQGGVARRDGQMFDQKLEKGNLALEKTLHRGNDVRVMRGLKDPFGSASKIYVYDGLYKTQESWAEKNKSGCTIFKYKLIRQPGQPEAFSIWKSIQQWRAGDAARPGLIIPDLTSGDETQPVALVNDVDGEKGPAHFSYVRSLKYSQPFHAAKHFSGCQCLGGCQPGNIECPCGQKNDGLLPYSPLGVLLTTKSVIHECGRACSCPSNCRNRITQAGSKLRLEVFKTKSKGWGLRSWDPIRAGAFICEYAGDIIKVTAGDFENATGDNYIFDASRHYQPLEPVHSSSATRKAPFPLVITSKNNGNVSRFMNHSCSPNVFWQPVLRESNNEVFLHIAFFAIRHIPPLQELTYDSGIPAKAEQGKKKCLCGSVKCRGYFY